MSSTPSPGCPNRRVAASCTWGGGGSLLDAAGVQFVDRPDFPEQYRVTAQAQAEVLDTYRGLDADIAWTYLSPPPVHLLEGERTGGYRTGLDHPVVAPDGTSSVSYADFAIALVDELERSDHPNQLFTVGW